MGGWRVLLLVLLKFALVLRVAGARGLAQRLIGRVVVVRRLDAVVLAVALVAVVLTSRRRQRLL